jgi:hypothetical protein
MIPILVRIVLQKNSSHFLIFLVKKTISIRINRKMPNGMQTNAYQIIARINEIMRIIGKNPQSK